MERLLLSFDQACRLDRTIALGSALLRRLAKNVFDALKG